MAEGEDKDIKRISIDLPIDLIDGVDRLRKEWGFRRRGQVFERLLQVILPKDLDEKIVEEEQLDFIQNNNNNPKGNQKVNKNSKKEEKALVIVGNKNIEMKNVSISDVKENKARSNQKETVTTGIELPGFIRKQATNLKSSLSKVNSFGKSPR